MRTLSGYDAFNQSETVGKLILFIFLGSFVL